MAILWWVNTGIYLKMRSDVDNFEGLSNAEKSFWKPEYISKNIPLTIDHLLLSIIILGIGLLFSVISHFLEILYFVCKTKATRQASGSNQIIPTKISKDPLPKITNMPKKREIQVIF